MTRHLWTALAACCTVLPTAASAAPDAFATAAKLHRGVNVLGYDPLSKDPMHACRS